MSMFSGVSNSPARHGRAAADQLFFVRSMRSLFRAAAGGISMLKLSWNTYPIGLVGIVALELMRGLLPLGTAWLAKAIFDLIAEAIRAKASFALPPDLLTLLVAQAILTVSLQVSTPVDNYLNAELGRRVTLRIQLAVHRKINSLVGLGPFEDATLQDKIRFVTQRAQSGPTQAVHAMMNLIRSSVTIVGFVGILFSFSPLLLILIGFATIPQLYVQMKMGSDRFGVAFQNNSEERRAGYYAFLMTTLSFAKEIRLFNLGDLFLDAFRHTRETVNRAERHQQIDELRWQLVLTIITGGVTAIASALVIFQVFSVRLSLGDLALYTNAVGSVQAALAGLNFALGNLHENSLFYNRFTELLALPQPLPLVDKPRLIAPLKSEIEFRNVSFRYGEDQPWILHHINLVIRAGQCLALVGLNGAGKTTLVKLLTRLYDPVEGQILWDGVDIREFEPGELRDRLGAIFQDFIHYDLTARENIGLGNASQVENITRIHQAATAAGIHNKLQGLREGYETMLSRTWSGRSGAELSGGEWQKIALARMFMRNADLCILDEPTTALDIQAESEVHDRFASLMAGRATLIITHRFSTVRLADSIAVLEGGCITECGNHDELMSSGNTYARLFRLQAEQYTQ